MKVRNIIVALTFLTAITANAQKNTQVQLPAKAQQFLNDNFPKQPISMVKEDAEDSIKGFKAILSDNTEVEFWKNGNWREIDGKGKAIPTAFVVQPILDYVAKNYSSQKITQIEYHQGRIEIELSNKVGLEFDKDGKFVKID